MVKQTGEFPVLKIDKGSDDLEGLEDEFEYQESSEAVEARVNIEKDIEDREREVLEKNAEDAAVEAEDLVDEVKEDIMFDVLGNSYSVQDFIDSNMSEEGHLNYLNIKSELEIDRVKRDRLIGIIQTKEAQKSTWTKFLSRIPFIGLSKYDTDREDLEGHYRKIAKNRELVKSYEDKVQRMTGKTIEKKI